MKYISNIVAEVGKKKFLKAKDNLPKDFNVVNAGGYDRVVKLAADPKAELVKLVVDNLKATNGSGSYSDEDGKLAAIAALLSSEGKGFSSLKVDGDWYEVLAKQGKKSNKTQKLIGKRKKTKRPTSDFNVKALSFENVVSTPRGNGALKAVVKYTPVAKNFDKTSDGKIVLRRIACDIVSATFKYRFFPKLSLPFLKKKGGFLDFVYMDDDIRVTTGNQGGLFVHFRPSYYDAVVN